MFNPFANLAATIKASIDDATSSLAGVRVDAYSPSELITDAHKQQFAQSGFTVVSGAVSLDLVRRARRAINRSLGSPPKESAIPKFISSCPELMADPIITDLLRQSEALGCAHALLGAGTHRTWGGQIALRYPGDGCLPSSVLDAVKAQGAVVSFLARQGMKHAHRQQRSSGPDRAPELYDEDYYVPPSWHEQWHIDGFPSPITGRTKEQGVEHFTLLVGVLLADVPEGLCGNLAVFPGSHNVIQNVIREAGGPEFLFNDAVSPTATNAQAESVSLLRGRAHARFTHEAQQITGRAGDVVLAHYQLAHTVAPNCSPDIRYCIYFRLHHVSHPPSTYRPEAMTNIWMDFEGVQEFIHQQPTWTPPPGGCASTEAHQLLKQGAQAEREGSLRVALDLYERGIAGLLEAAAHVSEHDRLRLHAEAEAALTKAEALKNKINRNRDHLYPGA